MKNLKFPKLILLPLFTTLFFLSPLPAYAHILKTDGNIGAVLHIDPDDDPFVGQQASFFFEFKDKQNKFTPQNCDCTFSITEDGKEIFSQPLFQNNSSPSLDNASVFFTFPEKNVYQVKVTGKPNPADAFQKFTLTYDVRVARTTNSSTTTQGTQATNTNWFSTHIPHVIGGIIIGLFLIAALVKQFLKPKN